MGVESRASGSAREQERPDADARATAELNARYIKDIASWKALPRLKRLLVKTPQTDGDLTWRRRTCPMSGHDTAPRNAAGRQRFVQAGLSSHLGVTERPRSHNIIERSFWRSQPRGIERPQKSSGTMPPVAVTEAAYAGRTRSNPHRDEHAPGGTAPASRRAHPLRGQHCGRSAPTAGRPRVSVRRAFWSALLQGLVMAHVDEQRRIGVNGKVCPGSSATASGAVRSPHRARTGADD